MTADHIAALAAAPPAASSVIPASLLALDRWVLWRERRGSNGRITKLPQNPNAKGPASSTDPATWASYVKASEAMQRAPGIADGPGIVLGDLGDGRILVGIDLDTCLDDGRVADWASRYLRTARTYAEVSPSGTGVKLFAFIAAEDLQHARAALGIGGAENGRKITYGTSATGAPPRR